MCASIRQIGQVVFLAHNPDHAAAYKPPNISSSFISVFLYRSQLGPLLGAIALLQSLFDHLLKSEFLYRHRWRVGDLLMWDNCLVQHKAIFGSVRANRLEAATVAP
jgi:hypothetical protein